MKKNVISENVRLRLRTCQSFKIVREKWQNSENDRTLKMSEKMIGLWKCQRKNDRLFLECQSFENVRLKTFRNWQRKWQNSEHVRENDGTLKMSERKWVSLNNRFLLRKSQTLFYKKMAEFESSEMS